MSLHRFIYNFAAIDPLRIATMDMGLDYATKFLRLRRRHFHIISTALSLYLKDAPVAG
jgi:hypothetical protein